MYSRRNKLNKKVKDTCPKDLEKQKSSRGASQENQGQTLGHAISVSLGARRGEKLGS